MRRDLDRPDTGGMGDGGGIRGALGMLVLAGLALVAVDLFNAWRMGWGVFGWTLEGPDSYMRAVRAHVLLNGGDWFADALARVGDGNVVQHWTRPLDVIVAAGAWAGSLATGSFESGAVLFATVWPVTLHVALLATLVWALRPILDHDRSIFLAFLVPVQFGIFPHFTPGQLDWHNLALLHAAAVMGFALRVPAESGGGRAAAAAAGVLAGAGVWFTPVAFVPAAALSCAVAASWAFGDRPEATSRNALSMSVAAFLACSAAHAAEHGTLLSGIRLDVISGFHVTLFAIQLVFWAAVDAARRKLGRAAVPLRTAVAAFGALFAVSFVLEVQPGAFIGSFGLNVSSLYVDLRASKILETQPLFDVAWIIERGPGAVWRAWGQLAVVFAALPFLPLLILRDRFPARALWIVIALVGAYFLVDGEIARKWSGILALVALPVAVEMLGRVRDVLEARDVARVKRRVLSGEPGAASAVGGLPALDGARRLRVLVPAIVALALAPALSTYGVGNLVPGSAASGGDARAAVSARLPDRINAVFAARAGLGGGCRTRTVVPALRRLDPTTVMTFSDFGPLIMFRTRHDVLSIPTHRRQPGFAKTHEAMTARNDARALELMRETGTGAVLVCASAPVSEFYGLEPGSGTLGRRIVEGREPAWLERVELPPAARRQGFHLLRVEP